MNILVTGAGGFIGRHLTAALKGIEDITIYESFHETTQKELLFYLKNCNFIYHLAGVNRSENLEDFEVGNVGLTKEITEALKELKVPCRILYTSSIHASLPTPYGRSKRAAEEILQAYEKSTGCKVYIYRLTNLFGSSARPNYNSVIATFCHNLNRSLPIEIHDRNILLNLCYIDDVTAEFIKVLTEEGNKNMDGYYGIPKIYQASLGYISDTLLAFRDNRIAEENMSEFERLLYCTYLSYKE